VSLRGIKLTKDIKENK